MSQLQVISEQKKTSKKLREEWWLTHKATSFAPSIRVDFSPEEKNVRNAEEEQTKIQVVQKGIPEFGLDVLNYQVHLLSKTVLKEKEHEDIMWCYDWADKAFRHGAYAPLQGVMNWLAGKMAVQGEDNKIRQIFDAYKFALEQEQRSAAASKTNEGKQGLGK